MKSPCYNDIDKHMKSPKSKLTPIEQTLLEFLTRHKGEAVEREVLYTVVNKTSIFGSNLVDVHMKNLRKKLPEGTIKTVRGIGYMIV